MFPIVINDGNTQMPDDDIYYIVCKEGVYLKKRLGVMESVAPVDKISILDSVQTMAKMHIKKIPATKAQKVINFFKAVYDEYYSEAIVLLFYNQEKKHHKIVCPFQEVSSGTADYNKGITIDGYEMIGTIHSHAGMSAFHSGIDDADEESFDGLHITFGHMRDDDISISASIVANGHRVIVDPRDYINKLERTVDVNETVKVPFSKTWKWNKDKKKMVEVQSGKFYNRRKFDQRYRVQLSKNPKFDSDWMKHVEKKKWTRSVTVGKNWYDGWYGYGGHYGDSDYWKNWRGHTKPGETVKTNLPVTTAKTKPPVQTKNNMTSTGVVKKDQTPCDACTFKNHKINFVLDDLDDEVKDSIIEWALDRLDENAKFKMSESVGVEEVDFLTHYECMACDARFSVDESIESGVCPNCKVDDYLTEISAAEVMIGEDTETESDDEEDHLNMSFCDSCGSSFTKDFIIDDKCPTCGKIIYDNISTEETIIEEQRLDSGQYLDPDAKAIQAAIEADQIAERIPVPGSTSAPINKQHRKPGVFAKLFRMRNKKS